MTLFRRMLILREAREKRDAQSVWRARDACARADEAVARAERVLEQGAADARQEADALFDGMRGALWPLATVQHMHGKLESLRQQTEALRDGVADAEQQRERSQESLEARRAAHRDSRKRVEKTKEMSSLYEDEALRRRERNEELEMEEIAALRRPAP